MKILNLTYAGKLSVSNQIGNAVLTFMLITAFSSGAQLASAASTGSSSSGGQSCADQYPCVECKPPSCTPKLGFNGKTRDGLKSCHFDSTEKSNAIKQCQAALSNEAGSRVANSRGANSVHGWGTWQGQDAAAAILAGADPSEVTQPSAAGPDAEGTEAQAVVPAASDNVPITQEGMPKEFGNPPISLSTLIEPAVVHLQQGAPAVSITIPPIITAPTHLQQAAPAVSITIP